MANPFDVTPINFASPFQQLLSGYDASQKRAQETSTKSALQQLMLGGGDTSGNDWQGAAKALAASGNLQGATQVAQLAKTFQPETSADLQAYNYAVKNNGYKGTLLDFKKDIAQAGATRVNTNVNTGEKAYDTAVGKDYGEVFTGTQKAGRDSVGAINNLTLMENLTRDPNFYSGAGGETVTRAKQIAASLGIADANTAAPNELFKKISQKSVLDSAGGSLGTGFSNADRQFLEGTVANISNTPEGNRQIIGIAKRIEQRKQEIAAEARKYAKAHGGRIDAGFDEHLAKWSEANPAFPNAKTAAQPKPAQSGPIDVQGSLNAARDAISKNPAIRGAVIKRLQDNGIDPSGL